MKEHFAFLILHFTLPQHAADLLFYLGAWVRHAAQVVPVLNELGRRIPSLKILLRTTVPAPQASAPAATGAAEAVDVWMKYVG